METVRRLVHFVLLLAGCTTILSSSAEQRPIAQGTNLLSSQEPDALNTDLATYVDGARKQFNVPGVAIVVVKDGRVVFDQGFGERNLKDGEPVDVHTMFCIASNTKSFTAAAIEILADQGKLKLEDRVVDHLPWFRMADPYATRELHIRDILAHRSGLGSHAGDLLFVPASTYSTREVVERLRDLPLATGFRSTFAYENIMYGVATLIIEQVSGESYADFIREHIFAPIGMTESRIDSTYLTPVDDVATATFLRKMADSGQSRHWHGRTTKAQLAFIPALRIWRNGLRCSWHPEDCLRIGTAVRIACLAQRASSACGL